MRTEFLLGFDARETTDVYEDSWDISRWGIFLLRNDIGRPLSVDDNVWRSVIQSDLVFELPPQYCWVQGLWTSLDNLRKFLMPHDFIYWEIAVTQFFDDVMIDETGVDVIPLNPPTIQPDWIFLGYDIAEDTLLSGLSNMGYRDKERSVAIEQFAHALNNYHLFTSYEVAQTFAKWSQLRDAGHGPWFVTGIYRIPSDTET